MYTTIYTTGIGMVKRGSCDLFFYIHLILFLFIFIQIPVRVLQQVGVEEKYIIKWNKKKKNKVDWGEKCRQQHRTFSNDQLKILDMLYVVKTCDSGSAHTSMWIKVRKDYMYMQSRCWSKKSLISSHITIMHLYI